MNRRGTAFSTVVLAAITATLATLAGPMPIAQAATDQPAQPLIKARLGSAARQIGAQHTIAGRVAALDRLTADLPEQTVAYGVPTLWHSGTDGSGSTVAVVDSFGDPDAAEVLSKYSAAHDLPPANLSVITPAGALPNCTPDQEAKIGCDDWIGETDLDIVMVHAIAPAAHIVIAATPVNETEGLAGMPEMMDSISYIAAHRLADVVSLSFGTPEEDFPNLTDPTTLDYGLRAAQAAGIPVVAASGDCGATDNTTVSQYQCQDVFPHQVASWPASDPLVTAVGGTINGPGEQATDLPDTLWPDSGAGLSKTYGRPSWQNGVAGVTGVDQRSEPDITMAGADGTSEAAPLFAGVLALATQSYGGPLGSVNDALYQLGPVGAGAGLVDVTSGDNSYAGVQGFSAGPGFDVASGWGTVDAAAFVPALVAQLGG
ncbi:MAG TPA: S53 family peptidase [Pseudonocardiaceae bacterium]|nr:S53 family peptidase [Pseudonocardiaceae bacterium]